MTPKYNQFRKLIKPQPQSATSEPVNEYNQFRKLVKPQLTLPLLRTEQKYNQFRKLIKPQPIAQGKKAPH